MIAKGYAGELNVRCLSSEFDCDEGNNHPDFVLMRRISAMPSYDVYSLRVALREIGVDVEDVDALKLSPEMNKDLTTYMSDFTHPLIMQIYGKDDDVKIDTFEDVVALFRDPDIKRALEKLKTMADKLGINPEEVPSFLEDYGDIFLSLSYYRRCLDSIEPIILSFLESLPDLRNSYALKSDQSLQKTVDMMESKIDGLASELKNRFDDFERGTKHMWDDISAAKFRTLQTEISSYHKSLGGILCALSLKLDAWHLLFPKREVGSPQRRGEFIMIEMRQGMENVKSIESGRKIKIETPIEPDSD